jgi:2'-5' RNA ligase
LWPGEGVRAQLAAWSRKLHGLCGGRTPQARDLHLTLAFLGSVTPERVEPIACAGAAVALRRATLMLDRPGYWEHNRIVWAGASSVPLELDELVAELRAALTKSAIAFDTKPFVSHVTLLRDARPPAELPALEPIRWEVDGFVLAGPAIRPGGARYETLRAWAAR